MTLPACKHQGLPISGIYGSLIVHVHESRVCVHGGIVLTCEKDLSWCMWKYTE